MDDNDTPHKAGERIAKAIARAGLASRREAEEWIAAGRVTVNGAVIRSPALDITANDRVTVDGEPLPGRERTRLFLYYKPRGLMTTHADPQGRPTIFQRLPKNLPRLISIGRLDFNTEGLLLLTNDGALGRVLELPATGWLRRYRVRAHGTVTQKELGDLRSGITVSGIRYGAIEANLDRVQGSNLWLTFAIREGKTREVRNVLGALGLTVTRLIRVSFGPFQLGELKEGGVEEVPTRVLREQLGARLATLSGADFSTPPVPARASPKREDARNSKTRKPVSHSWRAPEEGTSKRLRHTFHGSRRHDETRREPPPAKVRANVLTDRKGRRIRVERHGQPKPQEAAPPPRTKTGGSKHAAKPKHVAKPSRPYRGRRAGPDRASGPRPSRPRVR
jgi:23S rRNA pseudouridine2605 synthase